jgi:hypothetical protein
LNRTPSKKRPENLSPWKLKTPQKPEVNRASNIEQSTIFSFTESAIKKHLDAHIENVSMKSKFEVSTVNNSNRKAFVSFAPEVHSAPVTNRTTENKLLTEDNGPKIAAQSAAEQSSQLSTNLSRTALLDFLTTKLQNIEQIDKETHNFLNSTKFTQPMAPPMSSSTRINAESVKVNLDDESAALQSSIPQCTIKPFNKIDSIITPSMLDTYEAPDILQEIFGHDPSYDTTIPYLAQDFINSKSEKTLTEIEQSDVAVIVSTAIDDENHIPSVHPSYNRHQKEISQQYRKQQLTPVVTLSNNCQIESSLQNSHLRRIRPDGDLEDAFFEYKNQLIRYIHTHHFNLIC